MVLSSGIHTSAKTTTKSKESTDVLPGWSVMTMVATAVSPPCSPDLAGLLLNSVVRISDWPWCTKWCMDWWQYPRLILPQQIPAPEQTTVLSFGLSVAILRLTSIPSSANHSFLEPPTSRNRRSYVRRCIQGSSSVVAPFISIGVISRPGVCRLLSRSGSRMWLTRAHTSLYCIFFSELCSNKWLPIFENATTRTRFVVIAVLPQLSTTLIVFNG